MWEFKTYHGDNRLFGCVPGKPSLPADAEAHVSEGCSMRFCRDPSSGDVKGAIYSAPGCLPAAEWRTVSIAPDQIKVLMKSLWKTSIPVEVEGFCHAKLSGGYLNPRDLPLCSDDFAYDAKFCSRSMSVEASACRLGQTVEQYCRRRPDERGCEVERPARWRGRGGARGFGAREAAQVLQGNDGQVHSVLEGADDRGVLPRSP